MSKIKGAVAKAPTSKKAGKYKVTFTGASTATGKVTLKLTKGKTSKTITGKLAKGVVTFTVPKLAKGTWKVAISWPGDAKYAGRLGVRRLDQGHEVARCRVRRTARLLELVGGELRVPLVGGEWVRYANLDNAASAPALTSGRRGRRGAAAVLRQRPPRRGLRLAGQHRGVHAGA